MILYLSGLVLMAVIRKYFTDQFAKLDVKKEWRSTVDMIWLILIGISMFLPLVSYQTDWLAVADRTQTVALLAIGVVIHLIAAWLLYRSHTDLDRHWHMSFGIREDHQLVTTGIYRSLRHPMYSAHLLWGVAILLIVPNWISGSLMLVFTCLFCLNRIPREEKMLIEEFGERYRAYQAQTGAVFPTLSAK